LERVSAQIDGSPCVERTTDGLRADMVGRGHEESSGAPTGEPPTEAASVSFSIRRAFSRIVAYFFCNDAISDS
jgi:hypothetical protein